MRFSREQPGHGPRNNRLDFGGDLPGSGMDSLTNPGSFFQDSSASGDRLIY